jgi:hypothetical protein
VVGFHRTDGSPEAPLDTPNNIAGTGSRIMTAQTLTEAKAAYPIGIKVRFNLWTRAGRRIDDGVVLGHRDTATGPFVVVHGYRDRRINVRPADVSVFQEHPIAGSQLAPALQGIITCFSPYQSHVSPS